MVAAGLKAIPMEGLGAVRINREERGLGHIVAVDSSLRRWRSLRRRRRRLEVHHLYVGVIKEESYSDKFCG